VPPEVRGVGKPVEEQYRRPLALVDHCEGDAVAPDPALCDLRSASSPLALRAGSVVASARRRPVILLRVQVHDPPQGRDSRGGDVRATVLAVSAFCAALLVGSASAATWSDSIPFTNTVASSPFKAGGYPVPPGATAPVPGTCRLGDYNSNRSESWVAVQPGTENLVGTSKVFFEKYSTFYDFHLGSYTIVNGSPTGNNIVQGYECVSTGTQAMPPSWMNNTDPNVDFDSLGRAYQATLPFNPWWANHIRPDGAIGVSYSDDLGAHWVMGNGGRYLARIPSASSKTLGRVEDKQWLAVNHFPATPYNNHVYVMWTVFNGVTGQIWYSISRDRGQTFTAPRRLTPPSQVGVSNTYVYPAVDAAGTVYAAFASFPNPTVGTRAKIFVTRSLDDGETWGPFVEVADAQIIPGCCLPNTTFRDGILENFAASPTHPGHIYVTWEHWDGTQMDVFFRQSTNRGDTWGPVTKVNDNADGAIPTDQFQPSVAAGPNGAVAVAFYDRRADCPTGDPAILPEDQGRHNFCIDTTLQAYKDAGGGAVPVRRNVRITHFTWDPEQPGQTIDGIDQMACAAHQNPCTRPSFIGDYFGLAISGANIYGLFVSTHYPSSVVGDGGQTVYYQQQVLAKVPRAGVALGY
jgi:hypothetical protein